MTYRLLLLQAHAGLHTGQPESPERLRRDPETAQPLLAGSTLLGALRKQIRDQLYRDYQNQEDWKQAANADERLVQLFGTSEPRTPGALGCTPGRLLLLPVRSLRGVYAWVTSPSVLLGLVRDLAATGLSELPELPTLQTFEAQCAEDHPALLEDQQLLFEELSFRRRGDASALVTWLQQGPLAGTQLAERLPQRLVLISDAAFAHFSQAAMLAMVHPEGTRQAHLEMLPPDSCFYSLLNLDGETPWETLSERFPPTLYLGSHRSTGQGLCAASLIALEAA